MSRIAELDLRSDKAKAAERACRQRERESAALDKMWDFPVPPDLRPTKCLGMHDLMTWAAYEVPIIQGVEYLWTPRTRWNLNDNWPVYSLVVGLSILAGLIVGSLPWQ